MFHDDCFHLPYFFRWLTVGRGIKASIKLTIYRTTKLRAGTDFPKLIFAHTKIKPNFIYSLGNSIFWDKSVPFFYFKYIFSICFLLTTLIHATWTSLSPFILGGIPLSLQHLFLIRRIIPINLGKFTLKTYMGSLPKGYKRKGELKFTIL